MVETPSCQSVKEITITAVEGPSSRRTSRNVAGPARRQAATASILSRAIRADVAAGSRIGDRRHVPSAKPPSLRVEYQAQFRAEPQPDILSCAEGCALSGVDSQDDAMCPIRQRRIDQGFRTEILHRPDDGR